MQQARARDRRARILDAALRVFSRRGYHGASVDEIADESGTSKGGLYFHFPGKQALFLALLDWAAGELRRRVEAAMALHQDPVARADAALLAVMRSFAAHRDLARLFMVEALGAGREFHERLLAINDEFTGIIQGLLDEAVAAGVIEPVDTRIAARAWFGAVNAVVTDWILSERPGPLEAAYEDLRPLLARSVGASYTLGQEAASG
ncbi:MAG TPA: TetR/AcrR family transcriptional regulator [Dehalococcoidia bacterium]